MNMRSKDAKCHCSSNSLSLISSSSFNSSTVRLVEWRSISDTPTNKGLLSSITQPKGDIDVSHDFKLLSKTIYLCVEAIILNRATKSLTLYYQMIGRGSRIYKVKDSFNVIDLGNNFHRFGPWGSTNLDWQRIFKYPSHYLDGILSDEDLENNFKYEMPEAIRESFSKSEEVYFDINKTYIESIRRGESSKVVLKRSIEQHAKICIENSEDIFDALTLIKLLDDDIEFRINRYSKCISKSTHNFLAWLKEDYKKKLRSYLRLNFDVIKSELSLKS